MYSIPNNLSLPEKVVNFKSFPPQKKERMVDSALKLIANGQVCVIIDCSDPSISIELGEPKVTKMLDFPVKKNILQILLERLKNLGKLAIKTYGKGYESAREPIMPVICVNELDIDTVEDKLISNNYYGYKGLLCFCCVSLNRFPI